MRRAPIIRIVVGISFTELPGKLIDVFLKVTRKTADEVTPFRRFAHRSKGDFHKFWKYRFSRPFRGIGDPFSSSKNRVGAADGIGHVSPGLRNDPVKVGAALIHDGRVMTGLFFDGILEGLKEFHQFFEALIGALAPPASQPVGFPLERI